MKATQRIDNILDDIIESDIEHQKKLITRNCLFIAGLHDPNMLPIDKEFYLIQARMYDLLCALGDNP